MTELINSRVAIVVINNHKYIPNYFFTSVINLLVYTKKYFKNVDIVNISAYDVAIMRNIACDMAVKSGFDFVFMCDVDMTYPNDSILRLYQRHIYLENENSIIVGSARTRTPPHYPTQFKKFDHVPFGAEENRVFADTNSNTLVKIEGTGLVGALIPVSILRKIDKPYFQNIYKEDGGYEGEDINFAKKCKKNNIDIYLDPQVNYGHELIKTIDASGEHLVEPQ